MTLTPNPRVRVMVRVMVRVRVRVGKVRKPYPNFQMVLLSMILSDLWPTFQGHDNIQCPVTRLTVSRAWSVQWFHFQWLWVALNVDFKVTGDALDELCAQLTRDLFAIAKFLFGVRCILPYYCGLLTLFSSAHFCMDELDLQWPSIWCYCHSVWCLINIISFFYCHFMFAAFCRCRMIMFFLVISLSIAASVARAGLGIKAAGSGQTWPGSWGDDATRLWEPH